MVAFRFKSTNSPMLGGQKHRPKLPLGQGVALPCPTPFGRRHSSDSIGGNFRWGDPLVDVLFSLIDTKGIGEVLHEIEGAAIEHGVAVLDCLESQGESDVGLADSWRADKKNVFRLMDEPTGGKIVDLPF
jgi:hypothetical protein